MNAESPHNLRLRVCLTVIVLYSLLVCLGCAARLALHGYGFTLSAYAYSTLRQVLVLHGVVVVAVWALRIIAHRTQRPSPIAAKIALASLPLLLAVSVDRLALVWFEPLAVEESPFLAHATREWSMRPAWAGSGADVEKLRLNSWGFRGREVSSEKVAGEFRILFLGDSVTFGTNAAEEDIFVTRVAEYFAERADEMHVTTLNASAPGYSPWQQYDLLIDEGLRLDPDLVVHVFCINDVLEKFQLKRFGGYSRGYVPASRSRLERSGVFRAARTWWEGRLELSNEERWRVRVALSTLRVLNEPHAEEVQRGWQIAFENLGKIVTASKGASIPIVIVCAPYITQVVPEREGSTLPQEKLAAFAGAHGVPFLDLLLSFREYVNENDVRPDDLFLDPLHFSPLGHEVAAMAISEFLVKNGLVK